MGNIFKVSVGNRHGLLDRQYHLVDARTFDDVIIADGYITKIHDRVDIPFEVDEIEKIKITGNRWDWKE